MNAFVSWSGGKDCMMAIYQHVATHPGTSYTLLNMCDETGLHSGSHGIPSALMRSQAAALGMPLLQRATGKGNYRENFKVMLHDLSASGIKVGIFGDIYLQAHRDWIETVCGEHMIKPLFPLWGSNTRELLHEFITSGFKAITVAINKKNLQKKWLGQPLDITFYNQIIQLDDIDPCAENGEYHTFVHDGPLFREPVKFTIAGENECRGQYLLRLDQPK